MASEIAGNIINTSLIFEWVIDLYSVLRKSYGEYLESPKFTANCDNKNIQWHMRLYPRGIDIDSQDYLFFALYLGNPNPKRSRDFKIINQKDHNIADDNSIDSATWYAYCALGLRYIPRHLIENPVYCILQPNNTLKFRFQLKLEMQKLTNQEFDVLTRLEAIDKYETLLDDSKFSDVSLISEGKTVKAHKCILAKSSSVFFALFDAEIKEKQDNTVEIADVEYEVLVEMD